MNEEKISLVEQLEKLNIKASGYFDDCTLALTDIIKQHWCQDNPNYFWEHIPDHLKNEAEKLTENLVTIGQNIALICKSSLLTDDSDINDIRVSIKKMRSFIKLRRFYFSETQAIHDEGTVFGIQPASQEEATPLKPDEAKKNFKESNDQLKKVLQLAENTGNTSYSKIVEKKNEVHKYRPNSAFIMMWMDSTQPDLEDVRDTVCSTFDKFGIRAIRADDIEHEGIITQRILDEVRTAEFLFADLTGARPNVYYEVGFAHALGKRVILFRKKGTGLHFDLAGYNCPEYINLKDLKDKLTKRLESLTNKQPRG